MSDVVIKTLLSEHPLFAGLLPLEPVYLNALKIRRYKKGEVIYRPGIDALYAYLISEGAIKFEIAASSGQQMFVGIVDKGFLVGELELLSGIDYHSTAIANVDTQVLLIPKETLFALIMNKPDFAMMFTKQLATNFYFFQLITADRESSSLKSRLAGLLMNLGLRFGDKKDNSITIKASNEQLSEMLNTSRQRVNMQLNDWQKEGMLSCHYGCITIHCMDTFSAQSGYQGSVITEENARPYQ